MNGYDDGYEACHCFWGEAPGSLLAHLDQSIACYTGIRVLDLGCGEGKNAIHLARKGAIVVAVDSSERALSNAKRYWPDAGIIDWRLGIAERFDHSLCDFDVVIAYGLMHCLNDKVAITAAIRNMQRLTRDGGYNVLCAFNDRDQDLKAHPGFQPTLLPHEFYIGLYDDWETIVATDLDLEETHPHNNIPHRHSMSRILARKVFSKCNAPTI